MIIFTIELKLKMLAIVIISWYSGSVYLVLFFFSSTLLFSFSLTIYLSIDPRQLLSGHLIHIEKAHSK